MNAARFASADEGYYVGQALTMLYETTTTKTFD
jgi:hypothetical protein